jgi:ParB-like chromosome segregation protein Spo0J
LDTLTIERAPLASLVPDPANARSHGPDNLASIVASLRRFGQAEPLIVQQGTNVVIAGNGRLAAKKELGWTDCDVVYLDVDSMDATALGIALNRTADLAGWDDEVLAKLLTQLAADDALEGVGFTEEQLGLLLRSLEDEPTLADRGPSEPPENPVAETGDLWLLGDHRLLCGDSTSVENMARLMGDANASLLVTDPPYLVDYQGEGWDG